MPLYDRRCGVCGWTVIDVVEPVTPATPPECPDCGSLTERAWLTAPPNVIGDACDFVSHNGERHSVRFRSKAEHKRWLKEKGYVVNDGHVGAAGSDKSKFSARWESGGPQWLADAEALARRNGTAKGRTPTPDDAFHITWTEGVATPEMIAKYADK
jgi:hypothetical protein